MVTIATIHPIDYQWYTDTILSVLRVVRTAGIEAYERVVPVLMYELHTYLTDIEPEARERWVSVSSLFGHLFEGITNLLV